MIQLQCLYTNTVPNVSPQAPIYVLPESYTLDCSSNSPNQVF